MWKKRLPTSEDMLKMLDGEKFDLWEEITEETPLLKPDIKCKVKRRVKPKLKVKEPEKSVKPRTEDVKEIREEIKAEKTVKEKAKQEESQIKPKTDRIRKRKEVEIPKELIEKGRFTRKDVEDILNVCKRTAFKILSKWVQENKIKRLGSSNSPKACYDIITHE